MDRIELNGVWYIKQSLTLQNESYQNDYSVTNLNVITYRNGDAIPKVKDPKKWSELTTGAYCYYDNDSSKGILYNWYAVNDPRGLAPLGWKIPNNKEMKLLHLKMNLQFNGSRFCTGVFDGIGYDGYWWSSSENDTKDAWCRDLGNNDGNVGKGILSKQNGFSVRCIKENI